MGTPLYVGIVEEKEGAFITIQLHLSDHDNYNQFGTDRVFAWKVLSFWMSRPNPADWYIEAAKYVRSVTCDLVEGEVLQSGSNWLSAKPGRNEESTSMCYEIELYDPATVDQIELSDAAEISESVVEGPPLANDLTPVAARVVPETQWIELQHQDGREWAIRPDRNGYLVRLRLSASEEPMIRERSSADPKTEIERLIAEQLAEGWTRAK